MDESTNPDESVKLNTDVKIKWNENEKFRPIQYNATSEIGQLIDEYGWALRNSNRPHTKLPSVKSVPTATHFILSGDHGGVLSVPDTYHSTFMDAYCRDIAKRIRHFIREQRTPVFPLAVDLDYKPKELSLKWTAEHVKLWVKTYQTVLRKCFSDITPTDTFDHFLCIVTDRDGDYSYEQDESNHNFLKRKDYKQGYRLSFPNLFVTAETALAIRQCVLRELMSNGDDCRMLVQIAKNELIGENVLKQLHVMLDESVYLTNGFRMIGSAKVQANACGRKAQATKCYLCKRNDKFDIGCIYKLMSVFPSTIAVGEMSPTRVQLFKRYNENQGELIRACSVRTPNQTVTPGFKCAYDISMYFLATTQGAQTISNDERKMVNRTERLFDVGNKDDKLKYETFLRYLQTTPFPENFPFNKMVLHDIKSIHLGMTKSQPPQKTYMILLHTRFCAIKNDYHSVPKTNFVLSASGGVRQKCLSQTCNTAPGTAYNMPPMPIEMFHVFFPTDALDAYCGFVELRDKQSVEKRPRAQQSGVDTTIPPLATPPSTPPPTPPPPTHAPTPPPPSTTQTMDEMLQNMSIYLSSTRSDMPIAVTRELTHLLKYQMDVHDDYCRTQSTSVTPRQIFDSRVLIEEYERKQGTNNTMFRSRVGRGGGRGGGAGRSRDTYRKRGRESNSDSD